MKRWKKRIPGLMILISIGLNILGRTSQIFADSYVNYIFPIWVSSYGRITGLFPFSVGEWMLYLGVVFILILAAGSIIYLIVRNKVPDKWNSRYRKYVLFIYWVTGIVCVIMTLNCFLLYQTSPINERFEIGGNSEKEYGVDEISVLRDYVVEQTNALAVTFERGENGYLLYDGDMKKEAKKQMQRLGNQFDSLKGYYPNPKGLFLSGFYSQQYIMGYYFPFSMEAPEGIYQGRRGELYRLLSLRGFTRFPLSLQRLFKRNWIP